MAVPGVVEKLRIFRQCSGKRGFDRHKHQHTIVCPELVIILIALASEPIDMRLHIAHQLTTASSPLVFIGGGDQALVAG